MDCQNSNPLKLLQNFELDFVFVDNSLRHSRSIYVYLINSAKVLVKSSSKDEAREVFVCSSVMMGVSCVISQQETYLNRNSLSSSFSVLFTYYFQKELKHTSYTGVFMLQVH